MDQRIPFIITIDTEGDNLWSRPQEISTENARYIPRFQFLCEKYSLKPVYLTNFEMAKDPKFVEMARDWIHRGKAEIGMHLHSWNSPPLVDLTGRDWFYQPYLIEFPDRILQDKVAFMTGLLEETFEKKIVSHRAGRWAMDERYFEALAKNGYRVDCSVTPGVSWAKEPGSPAGSGGTNYLNYSEKPYMTPQGILEVPMTITDMPRGFLWKVSQKIPKLSGLVRRMAPQKAWLRPNGFNLNLMIEIIKRAKENQVSHVEFMIHSSEFMPGGSPYFLSKSSVEKLFRDMEELFKAAMEGFQGMTLEEFYNQNKKRF